MGSARSLHLPSADPEPIAWDEALAAVLGYARARRDLHIRWTPSHPHGVTVQVRAYAYRVYDCVLPSDDDEFAWLDVLVVDGINGKMDQTAITALKDAADRAWPHVRTAMAHAEGRSFWDLPQVEVGRLPPSGTTGEALNDAWRECMATAGIGIALTHKLLHHKRPDLFPLIDNVTLPYLDSHADHDVGPWGVIHRELTSNAEQFTSLERIFTDLMTEPDDVPLTRLRIHDVLLWLKASGRWSHATDRGRTTQEWDLWLQSGGA